MEFNQFRGFLGDEDAVSPVIGVILMVAVTVILAAVIGAFVMDMGSSLNQNSPQAQFNYDYQPGASSPLLEVTHDGGDEFTDKNTKTLKVVVEGTDTDAYDDKGLSTAAPNVLSDGAAADHALSYPMGAGDAFYVDDGDLSSNEEVRLVWTSNGEETSQTVSKYTVPQ